MVRLNCRQSPTNHAHYSISFCTPIGHSRRYIYILYSSSCHST